MAFGGNKRVETLEAEVQRLNQWVAHLNGTDAMTLAAEVDAARQELAAINKQASDAIQAAAAARAEEHAARGQLADNLDEAVMHEAGLYTYSHRLDSAVAYKSALSEAQLRMKGLVRSGRAIEGAASWTVNNSAAQGRKMVKDISTLMLRAYNAEADALVRLLKPHSLAAAKARLGKAAAAIERLGKVMSIRISPEYHALRCYELELTADFLLKREEEKEAERERRAELRDQQKAAAEMKSALEKLAKERAHYVNLLAKLDQESDPAAWAEAQETLAEIEDSISGVERRAANIRAGHVYVISNIGAFGPDMVKIGMTRRLDPFDRVIELGDASVPFRFDVHAMVFHEDAVTLENRLHAALAHLKVNKVNERREFFFATPSDVKNILSGIAGAHLVEYQERADAIEWHASGSVQRQTSLSPSTADVLDTLDDAAGDALYADLEIDSEVEELGAIDASDDSDEGLDDLSETGGEDGSVPTAPEEVEPPVSSPSGVPKPGTAAELPFPTPTSGVPMGGVFAAPTLAAAAPQAPSVPDPAPAPAVTSLPPADWYPDPHGVYRLRYWDGSQWTDHVAP